MMNELTLDSIVEIRDCFRDPQVEMAVAAMLAGNSRARLWRIGAGAYLLWDQANNIFYLAGEPVGDDPARELAVWVVDSLRPLALSERRSRFALRILHPGWENLLSSLFRGVAFVERRKLFYRLGSHPLYAAGHQAGADVQLVDIDAAFLARADVEGLSGLRAEIEWMWPSLERFGQNGFGVAALKQNAILCWCTSEYVSPTMCGIGIETVPNYERQGVATAVTAAFVSRATQRGILPYWECDGQNLASIRVAEKAGFELLQNTSVWVGRFV